MTIADSMESLGCNSWLVGVILMKSSDKFGGNRISLSRSYLFWNCINHCNLIDLGFKDSKYTWSNMRYRNRQSYS